MARMKRNMTFKQMQVSESAHQYLYMRKRGTSEQLSAVLDRILGEYDNGEVGQLEFLLEDARKTTKSWMARAMKAEAELQHKQTKLMEIMK